MSIGHFLSGFGRYLAPTGCTWNRDFIQNLLLTVLDFQMHGTSVEKAMAHYQRHRWTELRTLDDLDGLLANYPDDKEGNTAIAQSLWGNRHWTRVGLLRNLAAFLRSVGVTDQETLADWARKSNYESDFKGKIRGMGLAIYNWLVMRQGVETVKPDVHLHRFVESVIERPIADEELVDALQRIAQEIGLKAYEVDWRIWEYQRGSGWMVPNVQEP